MSESLRCTRGYTDPEHWQDGRYSCPGEVTAPVPAGTGRQCVCGEGYLIHYLPRDLTQLPGACSRGGCDCPGFRDASVPAGPTDAQGELRERDQILVFLSTLYGEGHGWPSKGQTPQEQTEANIALVRDFILALPTVRDALAAQETLRRVDFAVNEFYWLAENGRTVIDTAHIRRALAGEQTWRSPDCPKRAHVALDCPADDPAEHDPRAG